jgi:hypothetical protein
VHGDALKMFVARRQQRDHLVTLIAQNAIKRERGIFSAAPAEDNFFFQFPAILLVWEQPLQLFLFVETFDTCWPAILGC